MGVIKASDFFYINILIILRNYSAKLSPICFTKQKHKNGWMKRILRVKRRKQKVQRAEPRKRRLKMMKARRIAVRFYYASH